MSAARRPRTVRATGLRATQRWFLDDVAGPPPRSRAAPAHRRREAADVVLPSATLTADERMSIYRHMYVGRLLECLESDFPSTRAILGDAAFTRVARRYVAAHPPHSWTLNHLGVHLPAFLRSEPRLPRAALVRDVAAVERAMSEAFDAEDETPLSRRDVAGVDPDAWATARLVPSASLRLLVLSTRANQAVTALRNGDELPARFAARATWVAVYRKDLRVWRLDLTGPMHAVLSALVRGRPLGAAVAAGARAHVRCGDGDPSDLPGLVRDWFQLWVDEGLFARVLTGDGPQKL